MSGMSRPSFFLSSLVSEQNPTLRRLAALVARHPPKRYALTERRRHAEIILFVESGYIGLESIRKVRAVWHETGADIYIFSESDWPFAFIPGLYCSLTRALPWARSWAFLLDDEEPSEGESRDHPYLFSFIGRLSTHPLREKIRRLDGVDRPCLDVSEGPKRFKDWDYKRTASRVLSESRFVLCPRGIGSSTIRVFETMRAGRVPVIISDAWIEPPVGDWSSFSLRVPERDVEHIPEICARHLHLATSMGELARRTFAQFFSPATFLDSALDVIRLVAPHPTLRFSTVAQAFSAREIKTIAHHLRRTIFPDHSRSAA